MKPHCTHWNFICRGLIWHVKRQTLGCQIYYLFFVNSIQPHTSKPNIFYCCKLACISLQGGTIISIVFNEHWPFANHLLHTNAQILPKKKKKPEQVWSFAHQHYGLLACFTNKSLYGFTLKHMHRCFGPHKALKTHISLCSSWVVNSWHSTLHDHP